MIAITPSISTILDFAHLPTLLRLFYIKLYVFFPTILIEFHVYASAM
jgi:hypothetical protein